jgi:magnesium transporter
VGDQPGLIRVPEGALKPKIQVFSYNANELIASTGDDFSTIIAQLGQCADHSHWIQINGIGDAELIRTIGEHFNINPLLLEDIASSRQRPKFEEYDDYLFTTSRIIYFSEDHQELINNQFSAIITDKILISFEETYEDYFEAVKARLQAGKGLIRTAGPGYMCYSLLDTIIDNYFFIISTIGEALDNVEDRLYIKPDKSIMYEAQQLKRKLIIVRRASWPERDKINDMIRTDSPLISAEVKTYLRDAYDHCIQIMDLVESYKEITSSVIDLYLSMVSNRMNEIMKVLTIISVIFIPLTFIAGVYGMNFQREDPQTHKFMPENMPELYHPHGYEIIWTVMVIVAVIQIIFFWRKGWFTRL